MAKRYSPEVQAKLAQVRKVKDAYEERLLKIPGVNAVGISPKIKGGTRTAEFAIVVHVSSKKPLGSLVPKEIIPAEIEGIKTDVVVGGPFRVAMAVPSQDKDDNKYRPVKGGSLIAADGRSSSKASPDGRTVTITTFIGTLGCIAINKDPAITDPSKQHVLLTNAHVLQKCTKTQHNGEDVGQPDTCSLCCKSLDHTVGKIDRDAVISGSPPNAPLLAQAGVDGGIATLDPETGWVAEVISTGQGDNITTEKIMGVYPITDNDALFEFDQGQSQHIYAVHKRGVRTLLTQGWVDDIHVTGVADYAEPDCPNPNVFRFKDQLLIVSQQAGVAFGLKGDSGSVVLNKDSKVVALLYGVPSKEDTTDPKFVFCTASPIAAVQEQLHIEIADSVKFPGVQTVPKPAAVHAKSEATVSVQPNAAFAPQRLADAQVEVTATPVGNRLLAAFHLHFRELRGLMNSNKRVAAIWRRIGGEAWIRETWNCMVDRHRPFPSEFNGMTFSQCFSELTRVLQRYASCQLADDLQSFAPVLIALAGRTYDETLVQWGSESLATRNQSRNIA